MVVRPDVEHHRVEPRIAQVVQALQDVITGRLDVMFAVIGGALPAHVLGYDWALAIIASIEGREQEARSRLERAGLTVA